MDGIPQDEATPVAGNRIDVVRAGANNRQACGPPVAAATTAGDRDTERDPRNAPPTCRSWAAPGRSPKGAPPTRLHDKFDRESERKVPQSGAASRSLPDRAAALKVLYLVATERRKNRSNPTGRINGWKQILNILTIHYGDRIQAAS